MKLLDRFINLISFNMADCVIGSTPPNNIPPGAATIVLTSDEYWNLQGCGQCNCKETPASITPGRLWNLKADFKKTWAGINENTGGICPVPTIDVIPIDLHNFTELQEFCTTVVKMSITTGGSFFFYITAPGQCEEELKKHGKN